MLATPEEVQEARPLPSLTASVWWEGHWRAITLSASVRQLPTSVLQSRLLKCVLTTPHA